MEDILFSPQKANDINLKVKTKVGSHLFMFCNYNPDSFNLFSYDAIFITSILNMYKLLIDCSFVRNIPKWSRIYKLQLPRESKELENYINISDDLRAFIGHNQSEPDSASTVASKKWVKKIIKKEEINELNDYQALISELKTIASRSLDIIELFIDRVYRLSRKDKDKLVVNWTKQIKLYYMKQTSFYIVYNQLYRFYCTQYMLQQATSIIPADDPGTRIEINKWLYMGFLKRAELELLSSKDIEEECVDKYLQLEKLLEGKWPAGVLQSINKKKNALQDSYSKVINHLQDEMSKKDLIDNEYNCTKFFQQSLDEEIDLYLSDCETNQKKNMLPQIMIHAIIVSLLGDVALPDMQ